MYLRVFVYLLIFESLGIYKYVYIYIVFLSVNACK